ncbi:uncharacterized protein N7477_002942 [Penicillium maclennaniae]|uniref:uncharacterized protein n=1 Tax=Penicillium maclennaniae TaxID=1343394 RepID=UPI0025406254|nr:uncharacterized protein N7477_002942 [Penicillium maclennaniae]KAJ5677309.1 hypothetical protein N7477_002942 [Penicillium maclennaniae]
MRVLPSGQRVLPSFFIVFLLVLTIAVQVSAAPAADTTTDAQTTADPSTTDSTPSVSESTTSTESTSTTTSDKTTSTTTSSTSTSSTSTSSTSTSSTSTTTMSTTSITTSDTSTSTSSDTTTSSVSTTTTSTSSSSTSTGGAIVTIPPTANAPYMQTSNTPEGTVFIAVGAILGLIGLAVLAWRGMVAWSVNRSVRRAALAHSSENKRLMRGSRKKRGTTVYTAAPAGDVSLEKLGAATRASVRPNRRVPSSNSGLFFSPTAGGAGSHNSINATGNRASTYLPSGYYAAAGSSTPVRDASGSHPDISSPSLPNIGTYDTPHNQRGSYVGGSTSSLNLSQTPQGRAPSAYLEDLFENHPPPNNSGRRHHR